MKSAGLMHVYYGDGKGKTTAALGLALRAYGQGFQAVILQFFKGSFSGELAALEKLPGIKVLRGQSGGKFLSSMSREEKEALRHAHDGMLREALALAKQGACGLLVLDEALDACRLSMLDESILADLLECRSGGMEVVITGHQAVDWIMEKADYVTEMVKRKHPYDRGITARKGIEY